MDLSVLMSQRQSVPCDLQDDPFVQELIDNQGGDFLTSLFDMSETSNPTVTIGESILGFDAFMNLPTSPTGRDESNSETSSTSNQNRLSSPAASLTSTGGNICDHGHDESPTYSPLDATSLSDLGQQLLDQQSFTNYLDPERTTNSSSDIRIDVDYIVPQSLKEAPSLALPPTQSSSLSSTRKAATLLLSDEEKKLLLEEGITLPTDMPLTKAEQKHLKRIQRKIKNKISAQDSRRRKKEYVEGLEDRVKLSTQRNQQLSKEVQRLQSQNQSLVKRMKELQDIIAKFLPSKVQAGTAGTLLVVLILSFSLFIVPFVPAEKAFSYQAANGYSRKARNLLFAETDQFGNVIDLNTGRIITVAGGHTPFPLPPWKDQTPAIFQWMNRTDTVQSMLPSMDQREERSVVGGVYNRQSQQLVEKT